MRFITHSGTFHADEVFATAILRRAFDDPAGTRYPVLRVRDASVAEEGDIVYDIGGGELDHHQKGGNGTRPNGVPYAACGLVWRRYGPGVCSCDAVLHYVDKALVQGIDAQDAGYRPEGSDGVPAVPSMSVSGAISMYNPVWDEDPSEEDLFAEAVATASGILDHVIATAEAHVRAKDLVEAAIASSEDGIVVFDRYCPWINHLFRSEDPRAEGALYVVFPSNRGGWNWQAVPDRPGSFGMRNECPEGWRGLRDKDLAAETGVPDAVFCHPAGFLGTCGTKEGAVAMARLAIAQGTRTA